MSDQGTNTRDQMIEGGSEGSGRGRTIAAVAFLGAVGVVAYFILSPEAVDTSGPDTSQTQEMQREETAPGVDTGMPAGQPVDQPDTTPIPAVMTPMTPPPVDDGREEDRKRIADLEAQLESLRQSQGGDEALQAALDDMQTKLEREREDADARYQALLAQMAQNAGGGDTGMSEDEREARRRLEEERQRRAAIAEAQIMSNGIVLDAAGAKTGGSQGGASGAGDASGRTLTSNEQFIQDASTQSYDTVRATRIANPSRTIVQGTTLNAVLETAISTELPGAIRAVVTDDVMSYDGMNVLIPRGSRLIGSYNSDVSVIQDRVQIAWNRAVTPEGVSVELGGYGADALGMSGQAGQVDTRFRQRFGSAALISLIGAGPDVVIKDDTRGDAADAMQDVGDDMATATQGVMADYLNAGPVIYIDQGVYMTVFVNRDLVF
ncbi:type IV secretion system protein VirB10 [Palleronia aestuarii]|uniref:Type IV secretion system protein VirB10 n=1 Tax=Palleronia aestuarii TaxID=568105 RepID=A0A2W7N1A9_9RHOB|nr:TrbI/VirB10 family protein [Palleronia aestuarii]PZX14175.1 type IV secretion system protein VirB10 [Palleronia aestuarii]